MAAELEIKITADGKAVVVAAKQAENALQGIDSQAGKTGTALQGTSKSSEGLNAAMRKIDKSASDSGSGLNLLGKGAGLAATAIAAAGTAMAAGFVGKLISVQREFDALNSSLITVSGSSAAAAREMSWLKDFAKETPFGLAQATQGFVKMKALGLEPTKASLTSFGNTASAMGKDLNQMVEAVADAATGEFERLKEFGIKAKQEGDKVSLTFQGVTQTIGNNAAEITQYLTAIGNNEFAGAMAERTKTLDGAISGLSDSWSELFRTISASGVSQAMTNGIKGVDGYLVALTERMEAAKKSGAGMVGELNSGLGYIIARAPFDVLSGSANGLNGTLNLLTGGVTKLNTSVDLLPDSFKTSEVQAVAMAAKLKEAEADFVRLSAKFAQHSENIYIKSELYALGQYIEKLKEAQRQQAALVVYTDPRESQPSMTRGASYARWNEEEAKSLAALSAERMKASGVNKDFIASVKVHQDALRLGTETEVEATTAISALIKKRNEGSEAGKQAAKAEDAATAAVKAAISQYESLMLRLDERLALSRQELDAGRQLTEAEKEQSKITTQLDSDKNKLNATQRSATEAKLAEVKVEELLIQQQRTNLASKQELATEEYKRIAAIEGSLAGMTEQNKTMSEEIALLGLSESAQLYAANARQSSVIAIKEEHLARMQNTEFMGREQIALEEEIRLLKERQSLTYLKGQKSIAIEQAKEAKAEWTKFNDSIYQGLTDSLYRGFEAGKGFFQSFWDTIKNLFKTTVLKLSVQGVLTATGLSGLSSAANAANSGGSGFMDLLSTANSASGFNSGYLTNIGASSVGSLSSAGAQLYSKGFETLGNSMMSTANSLAQYSDVITQAGDVLGYAGALYSVSQGNYGAAAGAVIGTYFGGPIGAAIGSKIGEAIFGSRGNPTSSTGDAQIRFDAAGKETSRLDLSTVTQFRAIASQATDTLVVGLQKTYSDIAKTLGVATQASAFAFSGNTGRGGTSPNFNLTGGVGNSVFNSGETAVSDAAMQLAASRAVFASLQGSDLPRYLQGAFDGLSPASLSQAQLDGTIASAQALKVFNDALQAMPFESLKDLSYSATAGLIAAAGGLDALSGKLVSYYDNFYTAEEKRAQTVKNITSSLNDAGFTTSVEAIATMTREQFRALAESLDVTTDAGQKSYAALIGVAGVFAEITQVGSVAAKSVVTIADAYIRLTTILKTNEQIAQERIGLEGQLNALTDTAAQSLSRQRDALDGSNQALFDQVQAYSALNTAVDNALATVSRSIAAEKERVGIIRDSAQSSVTSITGVFTLLRDQIEQLYGSVSSTGAARALQGNSFINQALMEALSTGRLPDQQELSKAIAAARGGLDATEFATQFEADKAALVMAGKLSRLSDIAGPQLTAAERALQVAQDQLTALDAQMTLAQKQVDALNGINTSVLSVVDAMNGLASAIGAQAAAKAAVTQASGSLGAAGGGEGWANDSAYNHPSNVSVNSTDSALLQAAKLVYQSTQGGVSTAQFNAATAAVGGDIYAATGWNGDPESFRSMYGFAVGTNYVPQDMVAQIHEGEMIVPKAYNPSAGGKLGSNDRLEKLVEGLTAEVQRLQSIGATGNQNTRRTADAVNGNGEAPVLMVAA
ncbi:hypothetical protein HC248_01422 [Polaromonas vacuolata]|uniref:Tape measure protein N-terminal domain-containing protein n=1 Tax=Polaromonas vacuolata TaxID=37448 RepID=A0A6H2H9H4_9BURK|nr:tape measure protein [Polaromonas vacuolata]QJC56136.1 hypothetical protein HC248_01422 [Polaromonas vacuolata]